MKFYNTFTFNEAKVGYYAALDLGSNTCRLLIARPEDEEYKVVESFSRVIRLGAGMGSDQVLSDQAIERALDALQECARRLRKYHIVKLRCVATEACRRARNCQDFLKLVSRLTGIDLEVIPEEEEARLALYGCMGLVDITIPNVFAFDIGGCSTEVMWTKYHSPQKIEVLDWVSISFGVVNIVEACGGDPSAFFEDIRHRIEAKIMPMVEKNDINAIALQDRAQMIGSSGTTTTLAAVYLKLDSYEREVVDGCEIPVDDLYDIIEALHDMPTRERANHPCIGPGRSDLVLGGAAILAGILDATNFSTLKIADRGVRDGILADFQHETINN